MKPRRNPGKKSLLAASFVVTAAASGCGGASPTDTQYPPNPPPTSTATTPSPADPVPLSTTTSAPPPSAKGTHIEKRPDGTCVELSNMSCPSGASCNPPPPRKVACPQGS